MIITGFWPKYKNYRYSELKTKYHLIRQHQIILNKEVEH